MSRWNMASYDFGRTQRDVLRDWNRIDPDAQSDVVTPGYIEFRSSEETTTRGWLRDMSVPKTIILVAVLVAIIVGIILVANKVNGDKNYDNRRGSIQPNLKGPPKECKDVSVNLGWNLTINCAINNDTWPETPLPGRIKAIHSNPLLNVMVDCTPKGRNVTCELGRVNCSSRGRVDIKFFNSTSENAQPVFTKSVTVRINDGSLNTAITQEYRNNTNTSVFNLSCNYEKGCDTYEMHFYGNDHILADPLECSESSFTDTDGHFMSCTATVHEDVILEYGNVSNLYCRLTNGHNSTFDFPTCGNFSKSNDNCTSLFDCTTWKVIGGRTECELIEACYPHRYVVAQNNTCHLKWCRNSTDHHIVTSKDSLFVPLCSQ